MNVYEQGKGVECCKSEWNRRGWAVSYCHRQNMKVYKQENGMGWTYYGSL